MPAHALLRRQLKRLGLVETTLPQTLRDWRALLETVGRTYREGDEDRYTVERSLQISSNELRALYDGLKASSATELAREREKLSRSLAIHKATLEASSDGVLVVGERHEVVSYNHRLVELWRLTAVELSTTQGDAWFEHLAARLVAPAAFLAQKQALRTSAECSGVEAFVLVDGRTFEVQSAPAITEDGATSGRVWFFRDVTERARDEERIRQSHRFLDSVLENLPHVVFVKDAATLNFVHFNRAGTEMLGFAREQVLGRSDEDVFSHSNAVERSARDRAILAQQPAMHVDEETFETPHRGRRMLRTKRIPIVDDGGRPLYLLGISEDITLLRTQENELRLAKDAAEKATRVKSDFLLNMSHEMRTPLNSILGFARVLRRELDATLSADQRTYLTNIVKAGDHMLQLVNDLLDLRRVEEGSHRVAAVELEPLLRNAVDLVRPLLEEKALMLSFDVPRDLPCVLVDERAVVQIVVNLLSNAAKFTPAHGAVEVSAARSEPWVHVSVKDSGIGIAAEDTVRLFHYFEQVGGKHTHHMKGSGVGLALTRALVEKQGGTISVVSAPGRGSTFHFSLKACA